MEKKKREVIKEFLKNGEKPSRPLVFPMIFSISAEAEGMSPATFVLDATKLSNALRRIYQYHSYDCILCYFCNYLEIEIMGASVDRSAYPPTVRSLPQNLSSQAIIEADDLAYGRIVKDVIQRLRILVGERQLLVSAILGPMKLMSALSKNVSDTDLESTAFGVQKLAQWFCQAGIDIIFFMEDVPFNQSGLFDEWLWNFNQIVKLIVFHEVLPVLMVDVNRAADEVKSLIKSVKSFLPCFICDDIESFSRSLDIIRPTTPFGIGLSLQMLLKQDVKDLKRIMRQYSDKIMLLTTSEEIGFDTFRLKDLWTISDLLKNIQAS
ncbi:MAG TPA: hypothetical protein ENG51_02575 [Deltaproteobacteria bacterium]|nr:hypothetical protein [Deltaproteobacteria bacterium]